MTKVSNPDKSGPRQAGVTPVEVTPQMVSAGLRVLEESGRLIGDRLVSGDEQLVRELLSEMLARR